MRVSPALRRGSTFAELVVVRALMLELVASLFAVAACAVIFGTRASSIGGVAILTRLFIGRLMSRVKSHDLPDSRESSTSTCQTMVECYLSPDASKTTRHVLVNAMSRIRTQELARAMVVYSETDEGRYRPLASFGLNETPPVGSSKDSWLRGGPLRRQSINPLAWLPGQPLVSAPLSHGVNGEGKQWWRGRVVFSEGARWQQPAAVEELERIASAAYDAMQVSALRQAATLDRLTGLYKKEAFIEAVQRAVETQAEGGIFFLDLDQFKSINDCDELGYGVADQFLHELGELLTDCCRGRDLPGRYGGDELCVLAYGTPAELRAAMEPRIRQAVEAAPSLPRIRQSSPRVGASVAFVSLDEAVRFGDPTQQPAPGEETFIHLLAMRIHDEKQRKQVARV